VNVINPKEEIKTIEEIKLIPTDFLNNLKKNDFFLDYVTGDLYEFRTVKKIINIVKFSMDSLFKYWFTSSKTCRKI